jgi:WD40 repeat protein
METTLEGHNSRISSICFTPNGNKLASGSWDLSIKIWDL